MIITPFDGMTRFLVQSESEIDKKYLVDLLEYKGNGKCACPNFSCRLEPSVILGQTMRCKHIDAVRDWLAGKLLEDFIAKVGKLANP